LILVMTGIAAMTAACAHESPAPSPQPRPATAPETTAGPEIVSDPEPGTEKGARAFVTGFLQARMAGDDRLARTYLSTIARDQYERAEGGLSLAGASGPRFTGWGFTSVDAADASSFEVKVEIRQGGTAFTETLFVGPGPDLEGRQRPWVVRGALREAGAAS
jgi:hypothetical protein